MPTAGPALVFEAAEQGSVVMAQLKGVINEDNLLEERLTATKGKSVLIDLANVERINSCGVRDWIRFAQRLEVAGNALYLLRCSPVVVAQLNMVRNFCGEKGQVLSFQAPYFCPNCDEERTETFPAAQVAIGTSPDAVCPVCKGPMEFDDLPDLYFAFAKIHGPKAIPDEIQSAAANFRTGRGSSGSPPSGSPPTPMPAGQQRPSQTALPARPAPGAAATPPAGPPPLRQSNPNLQARPGVPATATPTPAAQGLRPSNPGLRPIGPPAPTASASQMQAQAVQPPAARRPSSPGQPPPSSVSPPTPGPLAPQAARASGPKPPAPRPMMGGSPFPAQRPSGLKPGMPSNGTTDPTKK